MNENEDVTKYENKSEKSCIYFLTVFDQTSGANARKVGASIWWVIDLSRVT